MNRIMAAWLLLGMLQATAAEQVWSVGQAMTAGKPVVYRYLTDMPKAASRQQMTWLTVVAWSYDGSDNNGLPPEAVYRSMQQLASGLENMPGSGEAYVHAYTATGNNLREMTYYITDRETFMGGFNQALKDHPAYPISINFYQDKDWQDLKQLQQHLAPPDKK